MQTKINLKTKNILVLDHGLFHPIALRLCDFYNKVFFFCPYQSSYPHQSLGVLGSEWKNGKKLDTFDEKNLIRVENPYECLSQCDIVYATDVYFGPFIDMLRESGIPCVGPGKDGENLELERWDTYELMKKSGMDTIHTERVMGMKALREHLHINKNKYIKISRWRAEFESFHHIEYKLTEPLLDKLEGELGPLKDITEFIIVDFMPCVVEEGCDLYTVDGKYPHTLWNSCEIKDVCLAGAITTQDKLSEGNKIVNEQFSKILKKYDVKSFWSSEIRTTKDGKHYFIDPCMRHGLPSSFSYLEIFDNFGEIVWGIANGEVIEPKYTNTHAIEILISSSWSTGNHQTIFIPKDIRKWVKLCNVIKIDSNYHILKTSDCLTVGSLVAIGKSHEECKKKAIAMAEQIKGYEIVIKIDGIDEAIEAFEKMTKNNK